MFLNLLLIIFGLTVLIFSADWLVKGAASLAAKLNIAPLIIGLTIVSFGTSAPELTVNMLSAFNGSSDLALGNVIGSNIANILLVLGVVACIKSIRVQNSTVWKEIPFAIMGAGLLFVMANHVFLDGASENIITRSDGIMLMTLMGVFIAYVFFSATAKKSHKEMKDEEAEDIKVYSVILSSMFIVVGLLGLFIGGRVLVDNAVTLATKAGLSQALIGLTIVAIGTSLPELVTSVVAAKKGHVDLAIGNVIGSNIFNIFWVIGLTSVILPLPVDAIIQIDILVSLFVTIMLFLYLHFGKKYTLTRAQGASFVALYIGYLIYLVVRG